MKELFYAKSDNGELVFSNKKALKDFVEKHKDKTFIVTIQRETGVRSDNQNAWYWGVVLPLIAESYGHTSQELHEIYKRMFLSPKFITYKGKEIKIPDSTADLNKIDFGEYIERIRAEVASDGIIIPDPEQSLSIR